MGARIIGGKPPSCTYQGTGIGNGTVTTYPFPAFPIGTAGSRRYVIVCVMANGATVTGVKINSVSATQLSGSVFNPTFYGMLVTTGTTANIDVTVATATATNMSMTVWSVYDIMSLTPVATSTSTASPAVLDLNTRTRGVVMALAHPGMTAGVTFTWTGVTSDYTQTSATNNVPRNGAHALVAAGSPLTVRCAYSSTSSPRAAAISMR